MCETGGSGGSGVPRVSRSRASKPVPNTLRQFETQIAATDSRIDALVYELYDLAADEITLVATHAGQATFLDFYYRRDV
ncbi:MAG: hypothetical protein WD342_00255 [Verrucomicrobiales bacterium]